MDATPNTVPGPGGMDERDSGIPGPEAVCTILTGPGKTVGGLNAVDEASAAVKVGRDRSNLDESYKSSTEQTESGLQTIHKAVQLERPSASGAISHGNSRPGERISCEPIDKFKGVNYFAGADFDDCPRPATSEIRDFVRRNSQALQGIGQEQMIRENITKLDARIAQVKSEDPHGSKQDLRILQKLRRSTQGQLNELQVNKATQRIRSSMRKFQDYVLFDFVQWASVPEQHAALKRGLYSFEGHEDHWQGLVSLESTSKKIAIQQLMREESSLIDKLQQQIMHSDESINLEIERMHESIHHLQRFVDADTGNQESIPLNTRHEKAARKATALKKNLHDLSKQLESAARVIGWLEFEDNDPHGRLEYVGQLLREEGNGLDDGLEDGLGCMTWTDGATFAGEFRKGHIDGFGHETYDDGSTYKGQFVKDHRHGVGVYTVQSGERYSGHWKSGNKHGLGVYTLAGHQDAALGNFVDGKLVGQIRDDLKAHELGVEVSEVINDAMEIAGLARSLVPKIREKAAEFHKDTVAQKSIRASVTAALLGPQLHETNASTGPEDPDVLPSVRRAKPHESFEQWLDHMNICHSTTLSVTTVHKDITVLSTKLRKLGFTTPSQLLPLLSDTEAFDDLVDNVPLPAKQSRKLWKALEDLNVILTPRIETTMGPNFFEVDPVKLNEFKQLFERFSDKRDRQNLPRMGTKGLHEALLFLDIPHEITQISGVMELLDTSNNGDIDLEEFMVAVTEVEKMLHIQRQAAEEENIRRERKMEADAAAERANLEQEESSRKAHEALLAAQKEADRKCSEYKRQEAHAEAQRRAAEDAERRQREEAGRRKRAEEERLKLTTSNEAAEAEHPRILRLKASEKEKLQKVAQEKERKGNSAAQLQGVLKRSLNRNDFVRRMFCMLQLVEVLKRLAKTVVCRATYIEFCRHGSHAIKILQAVVRRRVPISGVPHTLETARQSASPASEQVLAMHLRLTVDEGRKLGQDRPENGGAVATALPCFLSPELNCRIFWTRRICPTDMISFLRAIDKELNMQRTAEVEVAILAAASNLMFRAYVRRKITQIRRRIAEKNARAFEAERERARWLEDKRQLEHRRMQEWIESTYIHVCSRPCRNTTKQHTESECQAAKEMMQRKETERQAAKEARKLAVWAAQDAALQQRARDRSKLKKECERQEHERQALIADAKAQCEKHRLRRLHLSSLPFADRVKVTPLKSKMSTMISRNAMITREWHAGAIMHDRSCAWNQEPEWDNSFTFYSSTSLPRLSPLKKPAPTIASRQVDLQVHYELRTKPSGSQESNRVTEKQRQKPTGKGETENMKALQENPALSLRVNSRQNDSDTLSSIPLSPAASLQLSRKDKAVDFSYIGATGSMRQVNPTVTSARHECYGIGSFTDQGSTNQTRQGKELAGVEAKDPSTLRKDNWPKPQFQSSTRAQDDARRTEHTLDTCTSQNHTDLHFESVNVQELHHPCRKGAWSSTTVLWQTRVKTPELPTGALSSAVWRATHPHAANRPRTSVRRLLLIQAAIRIRHIKRMEARRLCMVKLRADTLRDGMRHANAQVSETDTRHHHVAVYLREWELKMEAISNDDATSQRVARRREHDNSSGAVMLCSETADLESSGSTWLNVPVRVQCALAVSPGRRPWSSRRPPSLAVNVRSKMGLR